VSEASRFRRTETENSDFRAVVRDPRILILDDALSSVDTYTEEQILHELKQVMRNRTSILISHRFQP